MNNRYRNLFRFFFAFLDLAILNLVHVFLIVFADKAWRINDRAYMIYFLFTNIAWLSCAYVTAVYVNDQQFDFMRYARRSIRAFLFYFVIIMIFLFAYHYSYSRLFIILSIAIFGLIILISRVILIWSGDYLHYKGRYNKKVIVLGYNELSKKLVNYFGMSNARVQMEGYFEDYDKVHELSLYPILGEPDDCIPYAIRHKIKEIYSTISPENDPTVYELVNAAEKNMIRFKFVPDFNMFINRNVYLDYVQEIPVLSLRLEPLEDIANQIKKRIFDIAFSSLVIIFILSWLLPIIALAIKISSRGPVFFVQLRSGKNNRQFRCFKFRSLRVNKDSDTKQVTKDDERFTKVGSFLRKTNLDELPQFWNVFIGDMSVVGPRPHMLKHTESFSRIIGEYMIRHLVKPGITGWAQVNGYRGEIHKEEQLRQRIIHDIWYLENWTIWLDMKIIFLTVYNTFKGDANAY